MSFTVMAKKLGVFDGERSLIGECLSQVLHLEMTESSGKAEADSTGNSRSPALRDSEIPDKRPPLLPTIDIQDSGILLLPPLGEASYNEMASEPVSLRA